MDTTRSRFGIALAVSSLVIGFVGFAVYVDRPETPIKPVLIHRHASAFEITAARATNDARYNQARAVVAEFIAALNDDDEASMRGAFPSLTAREDRVLSGIRNRLGRDAKLAIASERLTNASDDQIDIDFVLIAKVPASRTERRLPFHATVRDLNGSWVIETLY